MAWYDFFSRTYDAQLETLYAPYRRPAADALRLRPGDTVIDVACGTGQALPVLVEAVGPAGTVVGVDSSPGMLRRARQRAGKAGWTNVTLVEADVTNLDSLDAVEAGVDAVLFSLSLTAIPDWRAALARALARVRPGGRCAIMDVHAERRTLQTRLVELIARADLDRRVWEPLEAACADFEFAPLDAPAGKLGGTLYVASGTMPE